MEGDGEHHPMEEIFNANVKRPCKVSDFRTETVAMSRRCEACGCRCSRSEIKVKFFFRFDVRIRQYYCDPEESNPLQMFKEFDHPTVVREIRIGLPLVVQTDGAARDILIQCLEDFQIESSRLQSLIDEAVCSARKYAAESMPQGNNIICVTSHNSLRHEHWSAVLKRKPGMTPEKNCSICLEGYSKNSEVVSELKCGHCFHGDCIVKWLENRRSCPECRYEWKVDSLAEWTCFPWVISDS